MVQQTWRVTGPTDVPPNAIISGSLFCVRSRDSAACYDAARYVGAGTPGARCIDVNGAFNPDLIDVWDCQQAPAQCVGRER